MLREEARPVLPVGGNICTADTPHLPNFHCGAHYGHSPAALLDDPGVAKVEADAQPENASGMGRQATISQVHSEKVRIPSPIEAPRPADRTLSVGFVGSVVVLAETVMLAAVAAPVTDGPARDAGPTRYLAVVHAQQPTNP